MNLILNILLGTKMENKGAVRQISLNLNWIGLEMNRFGKARWGEEKMFEFEFKGLEINWEIKVWGGKKLWIWIESVWKWTEWGNWGEVRPKRLNLNLMGWKWTTLGNQGKGRPKSLNFYLKGWKWTKLGNQGVRREMLFHGPSGAGHYC